MSYGLYNNEFAQIGNQYTWMNVASWTYETTPYLAALTSWNAPSPLWALAKSNWDSATEVGGSGNQRYAGWRAFDNNEAEKDMWASYNNQGYPQWLKIYGGTTPFSIWKYRIMPRYYNGDYPKSWTLEGSNDDSTYTTVHSVTNFTSWQNAQYSYWELESPSTAYKYWKINITVANASYVAIREMDFYRAIQN